MFGAKVSEDKVSIMRSDSLGQKKRENKLELEEHGDEVDLEDVVDDDEEEEDQFSESLLSRTNLYVDSPRVGGRYDGDVSVEEIKRRKKIGMATVGGIGLSIMFCILFLKYLSNHEGFNILPPTQQRFMLATTTRGAKENLEQYTTASRHTGTQGDQEMAKFIRSKAIDFGIEERYVKIEEFEILMNEPEVLKINSHSDLYELKYDFMASFKAKKNGRLAYPPFHMYSRNGTAKGKLVYAHYGTSKDYKALQSVGVDVTGRIVLVRVGGGISLAAKVLIAGKAGAIGVLTYNDPAEDGASKGKTFPDGPWRGLDDVSYESVYMGNGDPSTPDGFSASSIIDRISTEDVFSPNNSYNVLPKIPSMPISSRVAQNLMRSIQPINRTIATAKDVFKATWTEGGLNVSYTIGESADPFTIQNRNKYTLKKVWNTLITIPGTRAADRYVIIGAQRDSLNAGAVSPGSGNAVFLEVLRGIGDLLTSGWMPHRTLLLASFDGEQFGSVGSSEWIDRHFAHLGGRGVVYLNLRDVVRGSGPIHVEAAAAVRSTLFKRAAEVTQPSPEVNMENFTMKFLQGNTSTTSSEFHPLLLPQDQEQEQNQNQNQNATTTLHQAEGSTKDEDFQSSLLPLNSSFGHQDLSDQKDSIYASWLEETKKKNNDPLAKSPQVFLPGLQHRISPFLARLGIPSLEIRFDGGYYGVENGQNDSFEWMRRFGDPTFTYHRAAAQLYGNILLSYSDSIFLQYDFIEVARELRFGKAYLAEMLTKIKNINLPLSRLEASIQMFERAALAINKELRQVSVEMVNIITGELVVDLQRVREINTRLLMTEKAFLLPGGIPHMPWLKHAIYGISEWDDYRVGFFPGVTQGLQHGNEIAAKRELIRLCQTIEQAADTLSTDVL